MQASERDLGRLRRAVALAAKGRFAVEPNPLVGCVIEQGGRIVGEGWHQAFGGPHAEVVALALAGEAARGARVYLSLEPCARDGKKTPPCADTLVRAGVAAVWFASPDPAESGEGRARLTAAGIEVRGPLLPEEGAPLLARTLEAAGRSRPWTVAKWAMSADGRIAPAPGQGAPLTGGRARAWLHDLRAHVDAVLVGAGTVRTDDPRLTCRLAGGPPHGRGQPLRVVLDGRLSIPLDARLVATARETPTLVLGTPTAPPERRRALEAAGVEVALLPEDVHGGVELAAVVEHLRARGVMRLLVEGGARVHGRLVPAGLADQASVLVAPLLLAASEAPAPLAGPGFPDLARAPRLQETRWRRLGEDLLLEGYLPALGTGAAGREVGASARPGARS